MEQNMKWLKYFFLSLILFSVSGCTYFQSITTQNDSYYIAAQHGLSPFIWENRIYECKKIVDNLSAQGGVEVKNLNCALIFWE